MSWTKAKLGEIGKFYSGLSGKTAADFGSGRPFISYNSVFGSSRCFIAGQPLVRLEQGERQNTVSNGDIILTGSSETAEEVAMSSLYCDQAPAYLNSFCIGFSYDHQRLMPCYAEYFFRGQEFRRSVFPLAQGSTRFNISREELTKVAITLPPLPEQRKIAEILRTWDEAIETAEAELKAKQERKRWLMQNLLNTKRNKGEPLGAVGDFFLSISERNNEGLPPLSVTQDAGVVLRSNLDRRISYEEASLVTYKIVRKNNFIISLRSFEGGIEMSEVEGCVSPAYQVFEAKKGVCVRYFRHYFKSEDFIKRLAVTVFGIRDGKQISFKDFSEVKIPIISGVDQANFAEASDEAANEIDSVIHLINKLKEQKRGLMQKLLTGEVRVAA